MTDYQLDKLKEKYGNELEFETNGKFIHQFNELRPAINRNEIICCALPDGILKNVVWYAVPRHKVVLRPQLNKATGKYEWKRYLSYDITYYDL